MFDVDRSHPMDVVGYDRSTNAALRSVENFARLIFVFICVCMLFCGGYFALKQGDFTPGVTYFLKVIFTSMSAIVAASLLGYTLGFLFGIPRIVQRQPDKPAGQSGDAPISQSEKRQLFTTNTSLEEISDWLTKIIIGLGLVQFKMITDYLWTCSFYLASFSAGSAIDLAEKSQPLGADMAVAYYFCLIVSALLLACLVGYVQTRTRFTFIFLGVEAVTQGDPAGISKGSASQTVVKDAKSASTSTAPSSIELSRLTADDKKLLNLPRSEMKSPTEIAGWASAWARSGGNPQVSEDALREALQREPNNVLVRMRLAEVMKLNRNDKGYVNTVIDLTKSPSVDRSSIYDLVVGAILTALYLPPPLGYESAITLSDYIADMPDDEQPIVLVWRAAAFGQKYDFMPDKNSAEAANARAKALEAVTQVVKLAPDKKHPARVLLKRIFDPSQGGNPRDNDLEVFKDDKDFIRLILGDAGG